MKKIYSLVLLATTLLFSTNVKAQNVCTLDGVEKASLLAAFNEANASAAQSHTITLLTDVNIEDPTLITNSIDTNVTNNWAQQLRILGKDIVLNMNGHSINSSLGFSAGDQYTASGTLKSITKPKSMRTPLIIIYKGSLSIEGTGTINNGIKESGVAVALSGSNVPGTTNFSVLTVGKDATLLGGTTGTGIYVDHHCDTTKNANSSSVIPNLSAEELSALGLSENVKNCGYGVVINVNGNVYGGVYGIQISGNVKARPTDAELEATKDDEAARAALLASYPTIHINEGSLVYSEPNASNATGIYAAGYGNWTIAGTVQGSTGAYMKSGNVDIVGGATIESTNLANYNEAVTGKKSGIDAGGSAIVIEANAFYAGGNSLDVKGGDIIAASGYAIEEERDPAVTPGDNKNEINISAGNFQGGNEGLLSTTDEMKEKIKEGGTVTGGVFDDATITEFLPNIEGYIQYADGGDNKYQVVPLPQGEEIQSNPATAADDSYVKMSGTTSFTVENGEVRTFAALMLTSDDNVVTVKDGGKLVVTNAATILGNAKIVVEAGGTFIIEGEQGLIANSVDNLVLEADATGSAAFAFNPEVTANTRPSATVKVYAKANYDGTTWRAQHIGIPMHEAPSAMSVPAGGTTSIFKFVDSGWEEVMSRSALNEPFCGYRLNYSGINEAGVYTFKGNTVGNGDGVLNFHKTYYNLFGNSYTAPIDLAALFDCLAAEGSGVDLTVWFYNSAEDRNVSILRKDIIDEIADIERIAPMQGFILYCGGHSGITRTINYENVVWNNPIKTAVPIMAPVRRSNNSTIAIIEITSTKSADKIILREGSDYTDNFDNGCDARKLMSERVFNFYVNSDEGYSAIATDNLAGKTLSIQTKDETVYTMSFANVNNFDYVLRDNVNGAIIPVEEGQTYTFNVAAGTTATDRFELVDVRKMPTALDNVKAAAKAKGIYTVLGQYLGKTDQLNKLPNGIYVVDGQKIVK